jgi:hypothetical protein
LKRSFIRALPKPTDCLLFAKTMATGSVENVKWMCFVHKRGKIS